MICKECGAYNPDHASFCKVCAASLKDAPAYEEPEAEAAEGLSQDDFSRPSRTFAKPPVWKPNANFTFEPRQRPASHLFDEEDGAQESEAQDDPSFRRAAQAPRFRPDEPEEPEVEDDEDEDDEPIVRRKPAAKPAAPVKKRVYVEEEDEDDDEEEDDDEPIVRRKPAAKPAVPAKKRAYVEDEDEDDDEDDDDDEPIVRRKPAAKPAAPAKKRAYVEDDDDEDDYDDDEDEDDYRPAKKSAKKKRRPAEDDYDDDDDDDDYDDDDDGYSPSRKKKAPGSGIFTILLVVLLVLILAVVAIVVLANNVPSIGEKLPILKISSCSSEPASTTEDPVVVPDGTTPVEPVVSANEPYTEDSVNTRGEECVKFCVYVDVGETLYIDLLTQDDCTFTNNEAQPIEYKIEVPKQAFNPNTPVDTATSTINPTITLTDAAGVTETLNLPFTMTFPTISLAVTTPVYAGEPIMAAEGNVITIEGKVDTHTVSVTANGQTLDVYQDGYFKGDYTLQGETDETIVITATQDNYVSASTEIVVTPYVFVAKEMALTLTKSVTALRANASSGVVSVKGVAEPGATLVAASDNDKVLCGSVAMDVSGNFTFNVTFNEGYYGIANVNISAVKEGFLDTTASCIVTRMYDDRSGMTKSNTYYEIPGKKTADDLIANPTQEGYFRVTIRLDEILEVDGYTICKVSILQSGKEDIPAYVMNQSAKWQPNASLVGKKYNVYTMLNGLYPDTETLYMIAFFAIPR